MFERFNKEFIQNEKTMSRPAAILIIFLALVFLISIFSLSRPFYRGNQQTPNNSESNYVGTTLLSNQELYSPPAPTMTTLDQKEVMEFFRKNLSKEDYDKLFDNSSSPKN